MALSRVGAADSYVPVTRLSEDGKAFVVLTVAGAALMLAAAPSHTSTG